MAIFGNLLKSDEFKKFEKYARKVIQAQVSERRSDKREAFLTPDMLRRRKEITDNGRTALVLDYGKKGKKVTYTLADLNRMARSLKTAQDKFGPETRGAPIQALIRASDPKDITRAQLQIKSAVLYKIHGNLLSFRVTASDESDVTYHQVKIRLDSWDREMAGASGGGYEQSAKAVAMGRISFNCDCGRHRYWYRYLATIGGFGLDPEEKVFPKIRNPGLKGCCCKHVIKTLATLRTFAVQRAIANEMASQSKKKGFFSRLFHGAEPQEQWVADADLEMAGKSSSINAMLKEFETYKRAKKGFRAKVQQQKQQKQQPPEEPKKLKPAKQRKLTPAERERIPKRPTPTSKQKQKAQAVSQAEKDRFLAELRDAILGAKDVDQAISDFAKSHHATPQEIKTIAKKFNLI